MSEYGYNAPQQGGGDVPGKGAATASLVLGIIGMFFAGLILGIIGLYYAAKAKKEGFEGGMRTAGFVLSLLALVFGAISLACMICYGSAACVAINSGIYY